MFHLELHSLTLTSGLNLQYIDTILNRRYVYNIARVCHLAAINLTARKIIQINTGVAVTKHINMKFVCCGVRIYGNVSYTCTLLTILKPLLKVKHITEKVLGTSHTITYHKASVRRHVVSRTQRTGILCTKHISCKVIDIHDTVFLCPYPAALACAIPANSDITFIINVRHSSADTIVCKLYNTGFYTINIRILYQRTLSTFTSQPFTI